MIGNSSAKDFANSPDRIIDLARKALNKALRNQEYLNAIWDDLITISRMLTAWAKGNYKMLPWKSVISIVTALIYFVNPFDAIPDFIVGTGFIDDAAVIGLVIQSLRMSIDEFKQWEQQQTNHNMEIRAQSPV